MSIGPSGDTEDPKPSKNGLRPPIALVAALASGTVTWRLTGDLALAINVFAAIISLFCTAN
jgi:hypothetical protein